MGVQVGDGSRVALGYVGDPEQHSGSGGHECDDQVLDAAGTNLLEQCPCWGAHSIVAAPSSHNTSKTTKYTGVAGLVAADRS